MSLSIAENACRVCLTEQEIMINLYDTVEDFAKQRLSDLLENCSDLKIDRSDSFSKLICDQCTSELLVAAKFRQKCKRTVDILAQVRVTILDVKPEVEKFEEYPDDGDGSQLEVLDDDDNITVEEHTANEGDDDDVETEHENQQQDLIFEEIDFVEDDVQGEQIILFEPGVVEERLSSIDEEEEAHDMQVAGDDQELYDRVVTAALNSKSPTTIAAKPLVINCTCYLCGAAFTHVNNLSRHIQTHNPEEVFTCDICKYPFTKYDDFKQHSAEHDNDIEMIETVIEPDNYEVKEIIVTAESPSKNKITQSPTEPEKPPVQCEDKKKSRICSYCNKPFVSKSALEAHTRIHTGDRPFKCKLCVKSFTTQGGLGLHLRRHAGLRPYTCNVCGKSFGETSNLRVHMRIHTGEKPHKCTICNRSFARVFLLQIHLRTHTGERPYHCPFCEKSFAQGGDLASHKRIHTGERPHTCQYCGKGFIKSSGLTQHMRKHTKSELEANSALYNDLKDLKELVSDNCDILIVDDENTTEEKIDELAEDCSLVIEYPQDSDT